MSKEKMKEERFKVLLCFIGALVISMAGTQQIIVYHLTKNYIQVFYAGAYIIAEFYLLYKGTTLFYKSNWGKAWKK